MLFVDLTDRKKQILKVVVEDYIRTAEPVGSKAIAAEMGGSSKKTRFSAMPMLELYHISVTIEIKFLIFDEFKI